MEMICNTVSVQQCELIKLFVFESVLKRFKKQVKLQFQVLTSKNFDSLRVFHRT